MMYALAPRRTNPTAMIGPATSSIARIAAARGAKPCSICRSTASITTIASSTTMPMASTRPKSVRLFKLKPAIAIADIKHEGEVDFEKEVLPLLDQAFDQHAAYPHQLLEAILDAEQDLQSLRDQLATLMAKRGIEAAIDRGIEAATDEELSDAL